MLKSGNMDLTSQPAVESCGNGAAVALEMKDKDWTSPPPAYVAMVDPFLVEALQNPRHRLTILRMELDIQKFMQNPNAHQFEFPHFPTSYLRLAAHRVAQHYSLQTMVLDNSADGQGIRILVLKKPECKLPAVYLSDVPAKDSDTDKLDQIKIVMRPRPKSSSNDANKLGLKGSPVRSVEERKEEYERARARIFSSPADSGSEDSWSQVISDGRSHNVDETEVSKNSVDGDKNLCSRETGSSSRVAILRDREKDLTDPDYDRSYGRYARTIPNPQSFNPAAPFNVQNFQPPFVHYDSVFPQMAQIPSPQPSLNYMSPGMSPYCAMGSNHTSTGGLYMQWPTQSVMYAQSYDQLRHVFFQAPFCQQPLSFDYSQNHR